MPVLYVCIVLWPFFLTFNFNLFMLILSRKYILPNDLLYLSVIHRNIMCILNKSRHDVRINLIYEYEFKKNII